MAWLCFYISTEDLPPKYAIQQQEDAEEEDKKRVEEKNGESALTSVDALQLSVDERRFVERMFCMGISAEESLQALAYAREIGRKRDRERKGKKLSHKEKLEEFLRAEGSAKKSFRKLTCRSLMDSDENDGVSLFLCPMCIQTQR